MLRITVTYSIQAHNREYLANAALFASGGVFLFFVFFTVHVEVVQVVREDTSWARYHTRKQQQHIISVSFPLFLYVCKSVKTNKKTV